MKTAHEVLTTLDDEFTRKDVKLEMADRGYCIQYGQQVIEYLEIHGLITRTAHGLYEKVAYKKTPAESDSTKIIHNII